MEGLDLKMVVALGENDVKSEPALAEPVPAFDTTTLAPVASATPGARSSATFTAIAPAVSENELVALDANAMLAASASVIEAVNVAGLAIEPPLAEASPSATVSLAPSTRRSESGVSATVSVAPSIEPAGNVTVVGANAA